MMFLIRCFLTCVLAFASGRATAAPPADTLPRVQLSYAAHLWQPTDYRYAGGETPFAERSYEPGVSLEVEARLHPAFSLLATAGTEVERGWVDFGDLPVARAGGSDDVFLRPFRPVERQYRRFYLGLGAQVNVRIGHGDLSLGGLATYGALLLLDMVTVGDVEPIRGIPGSNFVRPPAAGIAYTARLRYAAVGQIGGRAHLVYTYWVDQRFAVRAGGYLSLAGVATTGGHERGTPDRYRLKSIIHSEDFDPRKANYGLPAPSLLDPGDPTRRVGQTGLLVGIVFRPLPNANK